MSEYKRLISYMYNYENGIKRNNIGYVRVEARNGQCKMTISIKALSLNNSSLKTYIFKRDNDKIKCFYLGDLLVNSINSDMKVITNSENIMNSNVNLSEMGGVIVYSTPEKFFATEWDDHPIVISEVEEALNMEENNTAETIGAIAEKLLKSSTNQQEVQHHIKQQPKQEIRHEAEQEARKRAEDARIQAGQEAKIQVEQKARREAEQEARERAEQEARIQAEQEAGKRAEQKARREAEQEARERAEGARIQAEQEARKRAEQEAKIKEEQEAKQEAERDARQEAILKMIQETRSRENLEDNIHDFQNNKGIQNRNTSTIDVGHVHKRNSAPAIEYAFDKESQNYSNERENANECRYPVDYEFFDYYRKNKEKTIDDLNREDVEKNNENQSKERQGPLKIFDQYPKIYPFDDDEVLNCIRIEPRDIGILPMESWILGNNSFLLHGYYNHKHLIFARRKKDNKEQYVLGVPGVFENKEKFIANMFGFNEFKPAKAKMIKNGNFGYWFTEIKNVNNK